MEPRELLTLADTYNPQREQCATSVRPRGTFLPGRGGEGSWSPSNITPYIASQQKVL